MKTITVKETFEQGLDRKQGGMLKLTPGTYRVLESKEGLLVDLAPQKPRLIPPEVVVKLIELKLITVA
jgi:hypothetical protein